MSWDSLVRYMASDEKSNNELELELVKIKTQNEGYEERKKDLEKNLMDLRERIDELNINADNLKKENSTLKMNRENFDKELQIKEDQIRRLEDEKINLDSSLRELKSNHNILKNEIQSKLNPLEKIERTFFANTGPKGKGMLGEKQLEVILEKSGLPSENWTKNLPVGSNVVEFAIKSENDKWIPVDSKVLDVVIDDKGFAIIDEAYTKKIKGQAKEVAKYLGKKNTSDYGLLILQSDDVYIKCFEMFPNFFQEMIKEYKVYVMGPSSFVQFASSISNILEIYEKVQNDEKIFDGISSLMESTRLFGDNVIKAQKALNIAVNTHYGLMGRKYNKLANTVNKEGEVKLLPIPEDGIE